jgi:CheY-like chemotaxis protein
MAEMADSPGRLARVLVVDDNQDAATTLGALLAAAGYAVATSFDGESALRVAEQFAPDACLLDIAMPGMDGYELARRLRQSFPDRPPLLAAVTGYGDTTHLDRAASAGFDLHFTKPTDPAELTGQLAWCARRKSAAGA